MGLEAERMDTNEDKAFFAHLEAVVAGAPEPDGCAECAADLAAENGWLREAEYDAETQEDLALHEGWSIATAYDGEPEA
jgi:hypothetical protein